MHCPPARSIKAVALRIGRRFRPSLPSITFSDPAKKNYYGLDDQSLPRAKSRTRGVTIPWSLLVRLGYFLSLHMNPRMLIWRAKHLDHDRLMHSVACVGNPASPPPLTDSMITHGV
jgi:hypothetical protein